MKYNNLILFVLAVVLLIGNVLYLYPKYLAFNKAPLVEANPAVTNVADQLGEAVKTNLQQGAISVTSFVATPSQKDIDSFAKFYKSIQTETIFRIKVWDADYRVIWSNSPKLIGQRFPDNEEVIKGYKTGERVLEGKINNKGGSDVSELSTENAYNNYIEMYIPVKNQNGKVVGIIEIYHVLEDLVSQLRNEFYRSAVITLGGSVVVLVIAAFAFKKKN